MVLLLLINTLQCTVHLESNVIVVRHGFPIPISIGNLFYFTDFFVLLRGVSYYIRATSATAGTKQCKSRIYSTKEMVQLLANQLCGYNIKVIIKSYLNIFIGKDGHEGIILSQSKKFGSESSGSAGRKIGTSGTAIAQLNGTLKSSSNTVVSLNGIGNRQANVIYRTCHEAHAADSSLKSGTHWIDPDGKGVGDDPIRVHCNMTTGN